jgi:hypothetical protein
MMSDQQTPEEHPPERERIERQASEDPTETTEWEKQKHPGPIAQEDEDERETERWQQDKA